MKRMTILLVLSMVLLAGPFSLRAYDDSAFHWKVLPEVIWAPASSGGTWVTEVQITSMTSTPATVSAIFFYGDGNFRGSFVLTTALAQYHTVKFSNILYTMDLLDVGAFDYYGKVGAVWFQTSNQDAAIHVTSKTINGNYGKTFPGLAVIEGNSAAQGRNMIIPSIVKTPTYRTFTGFFNTSLSVTYTVEFRIINSNNELVGSAFTKTFVPFQYLVFNPFAEAGISTGSYSNHFLFVYPTAGGSGVRGIMGYGAIANNISNDPAGLIALPFNTTPHPREQVSVLE